MAIAIRPGKPLRPVSLGDRYRLDEGRVFLSGIQALVRVLVDQRRADAAAGLRTGTLVSGYQGSPLGGFDQEVARLGDLAAEHGIVARPALNEELGATSVWGSQLAPGLPGATVDGVVGVWYGKAPGVDRAADAIRHGNFVGTSPHGGVLALAGDDPSCKSSTIPSASESLLASLHVPVFFPGTVQEVIDLGRHAIACSRASGLWAALKVVTEIADATATADVGLTRVHPVMPQLDWDGRPYVHAPSAHLLAPDSLEMERTMVDVRTELARAYARLNGLNRVTHDAPGARLGVVAAGTPYYDLLQALSEMGLGDGAPLRILKVDMISPLDEQAVRDFAHGLDEVLVLEHKGPFLETLVREALYGTSGAPAVTGRRDDRGAPLVPGAGALDADRIAPVVGARLLAHGHDAPGIRVRLDELDRIAVRPAPALTQRTPFFCSGCPHNTSTVADDDALVGGGIGCHTMVLLNPAGKGLLSGVTQMGGEGAQWIGISPFVSREHFLQNLGDGTYHHSGSLAVRAAVAAGVNITYKLLYNDAVAMTGGQHIEGQLTVPRLCRELEAEGVRRIVITAEEPQRYRGVELPAIAEVRGRDALRTAQRELAQVDGVTVLIHDQACAAEKRRARKRGKLADPPQQVHINERVCEGCGDCGEKSGCLSVEPVQTEFGRKTRIHQASCNKDLSCLEGDCPSFLTIIPPAEAAQARRAAAPLPQAALPEPDRLTDTDEVRLRMVGIGGTGVVTISQIVGMAALIDGGQATGLDQTGLSQKGGMVVSDLRLGMTAGPSGRTNAARADVLLGFDILGVAAARNLAVADPARTVAVVSTSAVPTGRMVVDPAEAAPDGASALAAIEGVTRSSLNVYVDAIALSEALFDDHMPANAIVLGAAWQRGTLPVSREALREAFRLNGAAVERNLAAFEWGRAVVAAPDEVRAVLAPVADAALPGELDLDALVARRTADLTAYQSSRYAARYAEAVAHVAAAEAERLPGSTALSVAVAQHLHKLMAYKDEYEVARLHLDHLASLPKGTKAWLHLHPPALRALGLQRKLKLGRWCTPGLRALRMGRRVRGTALDPFGHAHVRRVERALVGEYLELVDVAMARLSPPTAATALELCELPDVVRGYEDIKLAGVERFRARAAQLRAELERA